MRKLPRTNEDISGSGLHAHGCDLPAAQELRIYGHGTQRAFLNIAFFSLLIAMTESFTVSFKKISFSTTFAMELAAYLLFGPVVAILAVILGFTMRAAQVP